MSDVVAEEYATLDNLRVRSETHRRYSASTDDVIGSVLAFTAQAAPAASRALDVGCGTGEFLVRAAEAFPALALHACDTSPDAVARAQGVPGVVARTGDALELPYLDDTFDIVWLRHVIYHLRDPRRAVRELSRVTESGGAVVLSTNRSGSLPGITEVLVAALDSLGLPVESTAGECDDSTAIALMREVLDDVRCEEIENSLEFDDPEPMIRYAVASLGVYGVLPTDGSWPAAVAAVRRIADERFRAHGARWSDPKAIVLVSGRTARR